MRDQYRAFTEQANAADIKTENIEVEDRAITPYLTARVYTPRAKGGHPMPVGVYFHGGGWCCGDLDSEDGFCRSVAEHLPCVIISVDYRLAPEYKSPIQLEDALKAWTWAFSNAFVWNGDYTRYFSIGQSAGGNLALALGNKLVALGRKAEIKGIAAVVPIVVHPAHVPSRHEDSYRSFYDCADAPANTASAMNIFFEAVGARPEDSDLFVIHSKHLDSFPATYIAVCGVDPLRDDGIIMYNALKEAGVPTKIDHYVGLPHVFWAFGCRPPNCDFLGDVISGIKFVINV